jgi:hypothetical protein
MSSMYGSRGAPAMSSGGSLSGRNASAPKAPKGYETFQQFTPEMMELFKSMFSHVGPDSYLGKIAGGDESVFNDIEAPAMKQFSGLQGNLASRFSGMGGTGSRKSSGFQNTMNQAGADFASQLQSQRHGLKRQAIMDLAGISNSLLGQQPYGLIKKEDKGNSWLENFLGGTLPILGAGVGGFFGGPAGAQIGGAVGGAAGKAFF